MVPVAEAPIRWPFDAKSWFIGKDTILGKIEGKRRKGQQRIRWLDWITDSMDLNLSKLWEIVRLQKPACCSLWGCTELDMTW